MNKNQALQDIYKNTKIFEKVEICNSTLYIHMSSDKENANLSRLTLPMQSGDTD